MLLLNLNRTDLRLDLYNTRQLLKYFSYAVWDKKQPMEWIKSARLFGEKNCKKILFDTKNHPKSQFIYLYIGLSGVIYVCISFFDNNQSLDEFQKW